MATVNDEPTTVSREGVTVVRTTDRKPDGVTAEFDVQTERDAPTAIVVVQEVLTGVPDEDVGFHPDREPETWSVEDSQVRFEATVAPDEEYRTVLGVRTGGEAIDPLAGRPRIASADVVDATPDEVDSTPEDAEDVDDIGEPFADDGPFAADPEAVDSDAAPTVGDGGEGNTEVADPIGEVPESDPDSEDGAAEDEDWVETSGDAVIAPPPVADEDDEEESDAAEDAEGAEREPAFEGTVAEALADELGSGAVDPETREQLVEALAPDDLSLRESDVARIDHLQSRTEDFAAYADVMEAFIDEHGSAEAFADDVRGDIEEFRADVAGELAEMRDDLEAVEAHLQSAAEEREELRSEVDDVAAEIEEIEDVTDDVAALEEDVDELEDLEMALEDVEVELEDVTDRIEQLREDQTDRIDELEEHIQEFRQLRDGLQTAFGSDVAAPGDDADDE